MVLDNTRSSGDTQESYEIEFTTRPLLYWSLAVFVLTCLFETLLLAEWLPRRLETLALVIPLVIIHGYVQVLDGSIAVSVILCGLLYGIVYYGLLLILDAAASVRTRNETLRRTVIPCILLVLFLVFLLSSPQFEFK